MRVCRKALQQDRFLRGLCQGHIDDVDRQQLGLARIKAALVHLQLGNGGGLQAQALGGQLAERLLGRVFGVVVGVVGHRREGEFEFCNPDHGLYLSSKGMDGS